MYVAYTQLSADAGVSVGALETDCQQVPGDKEPALGAFVRCDVVGSSVGGRRAAVIEQESSWDRVVERHSTLRLYGHPVCDAVRVTLR